MRVRHLWLLVAIFLASCGEDGDNRAGRSGAPDFRLDTLSHQRFYLNAQKGKAVVLVFWSTDCSACKKEMLALQPLVDKLGPKGLVVAAVCVDPENLAAARAAVKKLGIKYPVLLDRGGKIAKKYQVKAYPTTVIIDPAGKLCFREKGWGPSTGRSIEGKVQGFLTGTGKKTGRGGFVVGPYLLDVTAEEATVAFRLREALPAEVRVRDGGQVHSFSSREARRAHFVRVSGLAPGRAYDYEVTAGGGAVRTPPGDRSYQIRTAARPGESFSFAVYGDTRPGDTRTDRHHRDVLARMLRGPSQPVFCLTLGDLVDDGAKAELWEKFFEIESPLLRRSAIYPVMGDNDYAAGKGLYADYFPKLKRGYYHFEWGGVHFFGMRAWDARGAQPREELAAEGAQLRWLDAELSREAVQKAPFRVVFLHDPVYICRGRSAEILRREWAKVFRRRKVDVVFSSWHMFERSRHDGVRYVITGGAGAELIWMRKNPAFPSQAEARRHHFCRVDVRAGAMTMNAVADDGTVLDSITLVSRSQDPRAVQRMQRAARRLRREVFMSAGAGAPELPVSVFSNDCAYCRRLLGREMPRLARKYGVSLRVSYYDLARRGTYGLFMAAGADFDRQGVEVPALFLGRTVLGGEAEITRGLAAELDAFRKTPRLYRERSVIPFKEPRDAGALQEAAFSKLTAGWVMGAGLLDGVNPCAFATIIFLISYLSMTGGSRRQMLVTGGIFALAVFLAYLTIGALFYQLASRMLGNRILAQVVYWLLLALVVGLAWLSAVDFFRCLRGRPTEMALQLPGFLKERIRGRIRQFARNRAAMGTAAFALGWVIAGMELACTGQVYFPIVTMISEPRHRAAAACYLLIYNVAFVLPLVAVFLLAAFGVTSGRMASFFRRHVAAVKLGLTVLFVVMAGLISYNLLGFYSVAVR